MNTRTLPDLRTSPNRKCNFMLKAISTLTLFILCNSLAVANNCDKEYRYFLDKDDKPDLIIEKIGSVSDGVNTCGYTLHFSNLKTEEYFYMDAGTPFFDSYELLSEHKKGEVVIAYRRKDYQEIHHYKMVFRPNKFRSLPYIDSIEYIYPDKVLKKEFKDIRWSIENDYFIIKNTNTTSTKQGKISYTDYKVSYLNNEQLLSTIKMGGGSALMWLLLKNHKEQRDYYSGYYLSLVLKQFGLKDKSFEFYLEYLAALSAGKMNTAENKEVGDPNAKNIRHIFTKIPEKLQVFDVAVGDLNDDKIPEVAIFSYHPKDHFYQLQVYQKGVEGYTLTHQSPTLLDDKQYKEYRYFIEDYYRDTNLSIDDGLLHFSIKAKGYSFANVRRITQYFSLNKNDLLLKYSLNLWQQDDYLERAYFVINYANQSIVYYPKYKDFNIDRLNALTKQDNKKFALSSPISLANYTHTAPHEILDSAYYPFQKDYFDKDFKKATKYYKKKHFKKIKKLFTKKKIDKYFSSYPLSSLNIIQYNDIAFYLQKGKSHKNAIQILNKVIALNPDRIISYLNLADSYTALKQNNEADQNYYHYLQQLGSDKKEIPTKLKKRYSGILFDLSQKNKKKNLIHSAIGDLNNDKTDDFVFILQNINNNNTTLIIYLSDKKIYKQVLESDSVLGDKSSEGLSEITIDKNSLFLNYFYHRSKETYQFLLRKNNFILAGLESEYSGSSGVGVTSINFLTKKIKSEHTYFEYEENVDEPKETHSKENKKFIMKNPIKLENFNHDYGSIIDNALASSPESYSLNIEKLSYDGYGFFTPVFMNTTGKEFKGAKLYAELTDRQGKKHTQLIYKLDLTGEKEYMIDDNEITFNGIDYEIYHNDSTARLFPKNSKNGDYKFRLIIEHPSFGKVYSDSLEITIPLDVKKNQVGN